jgi:cell division protein FtsL
VWQKKYKSMATEKQTTKNGKKNLASMLKAFDDVAFFRWENIVANMPYFLFLVIIGIFYIWNNHRSVRMDREIRDLNTHLLEKQYYYNATRDSLTRASRQSNIADLVDTLQMQELSHPPYTIQVEDGEY